MQKYFTKSDLFPPIFAISIIVVIIIILHIICAFVRNAIVQDIAAYFTQKISIGNILYVPPNNIVLKNVSFVEIGPYQKRQIFFITTIYTKFSLLKLLTKRQIYISDIWVHRPVMDYNVFSSFIRDNLLNIVRYIEHFPKRNIRLFIKRATFELVRKNQKSGFINTYLALSIKGSRISCAGFIRTDMYRNTTQKTINTKSIIRGKPIWYGLRGIFAADGIVFENVELIGKDFYSKVWGNYQGNVLQIGGFSFINTLLTRQDTQARTLHIIDRCKFFFGGLPVFPAVSEIPAANIYILDIGCQLRFAFPRIQIERFGFSLNNNAINIKGNIFISNPPQLDLECFSSLAPTPDSQVENLKRIKLNILGIFQNEIFNGKGKLKFDFVKNKIGSPPLETVDIEFTDLVFYPDEYLPSMRLGLLNIFCLTDTNTYRIFLKNLYATFNVQNERYKFIEFHSLFYDGLLRGRACIDSFFLPPRISSTVRVQKVSANKLGGILIHFSKVYGRLSSQMHFSNYPHLELNGGMSIQKGYLLNFEFFEWLADFFVLPSLKRIDFSRAFSYFFVNTEGAGLHGIHLDSQDVTIRGYFGLGANDLVSSKLTLVFSKGLLQQSHKFTPLLRLLKEDISSLSFDFKLSGVLRSMNFKWLSSDFKKRLQDSIPNFIERRIERNVEHIIDTISTQ